MNTFKNELKSNFTALPNSVSTDNSISWKAKGIFLYLASKPQGWNFYMAEIENNAMDGRTALQSGVKELEEAEYLLRKRLYDDNGKIKGWEWILTIPDKTLQTENPPTRKPTRKETALYSKKDSSKKDSSKNDDKGNKSVATKVDDELPNSCEFIEDATEIATSLLDAICNWDPTHKYNQKSKPPKSWILSIERAMRIDGRTKEQLQFLIKFIFTQPNKIATFWAVNIQSGKKLRSQFDQIKNQIKNSRENVKRSEIQSTVDSLY